MLCGDGGGGPAGATAASSSRVGDPELSGANFSRLSGATAPSLRAGGGSCSGVGAEGEGGGGAAAAAAAASMLDCSFDDGLPRAFSGSFLRAPQAGCARAPAQAGAALHAEAPPRGCAAEASTGAPFSLGAGGAPAASPLPLGLLREDVSLKKGGGGGSACSLASPPCAPLGLPLQLLGGKATGLVAELGGGAMGDSPGGVSLLAHAPVL
jgi:hypothetical protein